MQGVRTRWLGRLFWALVFVPLTLFLLHAQSQQQVDPRNRALKAQGGADQQNLDMLATVVPGDGVVLLAFSVPGDLPILPADLDTLVRCRDHIAALPGVVATSMPPSPEPGLALLTVSVAGPDVDRAAEAAVATARAEAPPSVSVMATGLPLIEARIGALVAAERRHVVPWLVLALLVAATAFYRHPALAAAVLLPALAAIAWTGGIVALLGHRLDPVAALLDPVLLTIGVASSAHFVEAYRRGRRNGLTPSEAAAAAGRDQHHPAFLATTTTMVGLWSLCTSSIPAVIDFGVRAATGVALVHLFTFLLLPAWLPFAAGHPIAPPHPVAGAARSADRWFAWIWNRRTPLLAATAAVTAFALAALPSLRADNDPSTLLPRNDALRADHDRLVARLGGVEVFHLLVPARTPGTDPARLLPFVAAMRTVPGIAGAAGPAVQNSEGDLAVPMLLAPAGSAVRTVLFDEVARAARVLGLDELAAAGPPVQIARDSAALMKNLLSSLWLTLAVLFVGICVGLRSLRLGCLGMLPNLLPCAWIYGALAWFGRPVSVATAMIGCTMLGLIVDNSLHLLHHFQSAGPHADPRTAATLALRQCGRGMVLASALLVVGFSVTATSNLATTVEFSLLACSTIAAGAFVAGVVLPLLLGARSTRSPEVGHAV